MMNAVLAPDVRLKSSLDCVDCVDDEYGDGEAHILMKSEQNRRDTYSTWPRRLNQQPCDLARAGLYYTGVSDRVQCAFCLGILKEWKPPDDPFVEHRRHFPYCRFLRGLEVGNIPINDPAVNYMHMNVNNTPAVNVIPPFSNTVVVEQRKQPYQNESETSMTHLDLTIEEHRLSTFKEWPISIKQRPEMLARSGFYHIPSSARPDRVKCAYCQGKVFNWLPEDDPFIEHARCFSNCPYIRMCLGEDVIRDLKNQPRSEEPTTRSPSFENRATLDPPPPQINHAVEAVAPMSNTGTIESRMHSAPVQAVLEMGFRDDLVKRAVQQCVTERGEREEELPAAEELASLVMQLEDGEQASALASASAWSPVTHQSPLQRLMAAQGATSSTTGSANGLSQDQTWRQYRDPGAKVREENARLRDEFLCKICMENNVNVTFLPCGHLVCCGQCAMAVSECPLCRSPISGSVRTYF